MENALIIIDNGVEDIEFVTVYDVLKRAQIHVTLCAINNLKVQTSHNLQVIADALFADCRFNNYDLVVIPGGFNCAKSLGENKDVISFLRKQKESHNYYAAICAAPKLVLENNNLIDGVFTCYPGMSENPNYRNESVVVFQNCITSQGPGTALEFAYKLVEILKGKIAGQDLRKEMIA